jgi:hypothetical protein
MWREKTVGGSSGPVIVLSFYRKDNCWSLTYLKHWFFCSNNWQAQVNQQAIKFLNKTRFLKIEWKKVCLVFFVRISLIWTLSLFLSPPHPPYPVYLAGLADFDCGLFGSQNLDKLNLTIDICIWNGNHGGCDRSAGDAHSSAAPDPTFAFVGGPCSPAVDFVFAFWIMITFYTMLTFTILYYWTISDRWSRICIVLLVFLFLHSILSRHVLLWSGEHFKRIIEIPGYTMKYCEYCVN